MYYEDRWDGNPMNTIMKRCRDMDITLSNAVGEVTLPIGIDFHVEEGLECFQNDEEHKDTIDVGMARGTM